MGLKEMQFCGSYKDETKGRSTLLYQIGPYFSRRPLNTQSRQGFLDSKEKDPFLFVSQTEVVVFIKLYLRINVLLNIENLVLRARSERMGHSAWRIAKKRVNNKWESVNSRGANA